jgi:MGT family glycosyltransferase
MKVICYTSPARGHLFPTVPILMELARRGHELVLLTLGEEVARIAATGVRVRAVAGAIEALRHDDYGLSSPAVALDRAVRVFAARAVHEIPDLETAIREERPDGLLVDFNCWGAAAVAEKSGLPWALFLPYFLPWRLPGLPPFGPGLAPRHDVWGRMRDFLVGKLVHGAVNRNLALLNEVRARVGAPGISHMTDLGRTAPRVLYYTAEPFEYACHARPASVVMVGPPLWDPPAPAPDWLVQIDRPLVLVTCSTEYQADGALVSAALEGLAGEDVFVVATTGAIEPTEFRARDNARVERFLPHSRLLERAVCVVCHGGMGITQKALAAGVPVCVVPFGRDQLEVARHVEVAGAGVRLAPKKLTPSRLRDAVRAARNRRAGAERIAAAFRAAGGAVRAADELERVMRMRARPIAVAQERSPAGGV